MYYVALSSYSVLSAVLRGGGGGGGGGGGFTLIFLWNLVSR